MGNGVKRREDLVIAKLEGIPVTQYRALRLLQAILDESLYQLAGELENSSFKEEDVNLNSESYQQQEEEENKDVNAGSNQELEQGSAAGDNSQQNISQEVSSSGVEDDMNYQGVQEVAEEEDDVWKCLVQNKMIMKMARKLSCRPRKKLQELLQYEEQEGTTDWSPVDVNTTPEQESYLMQQIETAIEKLEKSEFLRVFMDQLQSIQASEDHFSLLVGSEEKLKVVIYGIGSIESFEQSRLQLSLVINMKNHLDWIGEVEVFDPAISLTELKVIEKLDYSVLQGNEYGRREAVSPTFFFMPHCVIELYVNLLKTNWRHDLLNRMVLLGNSFKSYDESRSGEAGAALDYLRTRILALQPFTKEYEVSFDPDDMGFHWAFCVTSLHLFNVNPDANLQLE
ncbi:sensitivity to red light reduced protein (SRR1) [Artemisia annua]|uniref:Sensitivity to red light reduced protein (SRR1) n=1 Tax=Artemisia annua TaxID=35608 RepID=A0A2U1NF06_ARTAN|nr:sensitivity to red light reduced protein (SRR1) [Artemisia annua]